MQGDTPAQPHAPAAQCVVVPACLSDIPEGTLSHCSAVQRKRKVKERRAVQGRGLGNPRGCPGECKINGFLSSTKVGARTTDTDRASRSNTRLGHRGEGSSSPGHSGSARFAERQPASDPALPACSYHFYLPPGPRLIVDETFLTPPGHVGNLRSTVDAPSGRPVRGLLVRLRLRAQRRVAVGIQESEEQRRSTTRIALRHTIVKQPLSRLSCEFMPLG